VGGGCYPNKNHDFICPDVINPGVLTIPKGGEIVTARPIQIRTKPKPKPTGEIVTAKPIQTTIKPRPQPTGESVTAVVVRIQKKIRCHTDAECHIVGLKNKKCKFDLKSNLSWG
jgi:hypothetical protein